ncbi:MAG TPA: hypothetical protein VGM08_03905 [Candidatus Saccharimonadales bacterium]
MRSQLPEGSPELKWDTEIIERASSLQRSFDDWSDVLAEDTPPGSLPAHLFPSSDKLIIPIALGPELHLGSAFAIPELADTNASQALANAAYKTIFRTSALAQTDSVQQVLAEYPVTDYLNYPAPEDENVPYWTVLDGATIIARGSDSIIKLGMPVDQALMLKMSAIRMLNEAVESLAQTTALFTAGLDGVELDMAQVIRSMDRNGVYGLLKGLLPSGIINPLASNGYAIDPEFALDMDKLVNEGEFVLSQDFQVTLLEYHKRVMQIRMTRGGLVRKLARDRAAKGLPYGMSEDTRKTHGNPGNGTVSLDCPASARDISRIARMIADRV